MCGIVGLFIKNPALEQSLGEHIAAMLMEMSERGPDSAGAAVYRNEVAANKLKLTLQSGGQSDWTDFQQKLAAKFGSAVEVEPLLNHAVVTVSATLNEVQAWLATDFPGMRINSSGHKIEIFKEKGAPSDFINNFQVNQYTGTHALGHTRMATESAVTTEHSHPFSTGDDLCLVHNGSLSNHNRLRENLRAHGITFQTDNDSEVAAGYLSWRLQEGDGLDDALHHAIEDLDGFYTFAIGTREGFAVLRDPIGCKPAIMAETDDWAAMSSEFRAIAQLPGVDKAKIWEPEPARIYSWQRS
ncbi:amidophosphoribosyltransferase [Chromatiales bacterium (ex Bugula neritina AB1)]|nr:amidophosphoribosyltransferase [Chromatiales bacterium (ex Bugula neritina AB1)]